MDHVAFSHQKCDLCQLSEPWSFHLTFVAKIKEDRVHRVIKEGSRHRDAPTSGGCYYFMSFAELPITLFTGEKPCNKQTPFHRSGLAKTE